MKFFAAFLIILASAVLWLVPVGQAVYDYRTDSREQAVVIATGAGVTTGTKVLSRPLYQDDYSKVVLYSDLTTDVPLADTYDTATRLLTVSGLTASSNRTLTIIYPVDALSLHPAIAVFMGIIPWFWYLLITSLPCVAIVALAKGRL